MALLVIKVIYSMALLAMEFKNLSINHLFAILSPGKTKIYCIYGNPPSSVFEEVDNRRRRGLFHNSISHFTLSVVLLGERSLKDAEFYHLKLRYFKNGRRNSQKILFIFEFSSSL